MEGIFLPAASRFLRQDLPYWGIEAQKPTTRPILHLRLRILAVFAVVLGLVAVANFFDQWRRAESQARVALANLTRQAEQASQERVASETRHLEALAGSVMDRPTWARAMSSADREALYSLAQPLFATWQENLGITHFYFHRTDGSNLLRVHLKDHFGDKIRRRSLQQAMTTGRPASLIETGLTGEWVLRVVLPWQRDGQLLGYLELGMDMEGIFQNSLAPLGIRYLAMMFKQNIPNPQIWESRRKALGFSPFPWDTLPDQVIAVQTGEAIDLQAFHAALDGTSDFQFDNHGHTFHAKPRPILGSDGHTRTGTEFFLFDTEPLRQEVRQHLTFIFAIEALLFALVLAGLHGFLSRIEKQVSLNTARLEAAVDARTRELQAYQQRLEELVEQRTAHLRTALLAAQDAARAKNTFIDNMTHELNTPIHGIMGMASLALATRLDDEQREYLNTVMASASDLHHLVKEILAYSHGDSQAIHCATVPFELAELLRTVLARHQATATGKGLALTATIHDGLPTRLQGDAGKIGEALDQLLDNALTFTAAGYVALQVEPEKLGETEVTLRFIVSDSGPGIPAEQLPHLFEPFVPGDPTLTRPHGGAGLGLAIARQLATIMGGQLRVESELGSGSRFLLSVPLQTQAA